MEATNKCLKEWNATIEALGQGKQTILIRSYGTTLDKFLLYPTFSYALKKECVNNFQNKYQKFVKNNAFPETDSTNILIKYYCTVENILEKTSSTISSLKDNYIWTNNHVRSYLKGKSAKIWILRVHKLKEPYMAEPTYGAIRYANLKSEISLEGSKPVLSDSEFDSIIEDVKKKL